MYVLWVRQPPGNLRRSRLWGSIFRYWDSRVYKSHLLQAETPPKGSIPDANSSELGISDGGKITGNITLKADFCWKQQSEENRIWCLCKGWMKETITPQNSTREGPSISNRKWIGKSKGSDEIQVMKLFFEKHAVKVMSRYRFNVPKISILIHNLKMMRLTLE